VIGVRYDRGIHLPGLDFWLDPRGRRPWAFVSHAHSDHTAKHSRTLLTEATACLMRARLGKLGEMVVSPFGERRDFGSFHATLYPAAHVLGSAQILIECGEGSLLYTGDFKRGIGLGAEEAAAPRAETLIIETTFGLPRYVFPPAGKIIDDIVSYCREGIGAGETPFLLAYSLGKAQEILAALEGRGLGIMLHDAVLKMTEIYSEFGVGFPAFEKFDAARVDGHVVICPPGTQDSPAFRQIHKRRVATLSGWAIDPWRWKWGGCDAAFPLSDHADYPALLRHVESVAPRRVFTVHGFAREFALDLRRRGIEAWSLAGGDQLELPLPGELSGA